MKMLLFFYCVKVRISQLRMEALTTEGLNTQAYKWVGG